MQTHGAAPEQPRDQLPADGQLSDEQRAQVFRWLAAVKDAVAPAAGPPSAPAHGPTGAPSLLQPALQQALVQPPPLQPPLLQPPQQGLRQAQQAGGYEQTQQHEQQAPQQPAWTPRQLRAGPWAFRTTAPSAGGGGSNLLGALSAGLPGLLSPLTPAAGAPAALPAPLFLGSPAATPSSNGGAGGLFGGDFSNLSSGLYSGSLPGLDSIGLGGAGFSGGLGSSGAFAEGVGGQQGGDPQAALQQVPLWSAADVLPATLGAGGLLDLAPGTVLLPPPPMPQPLGAGGDGPAVFRSRAPRREWAGCRWHAGGAADGLHCPLHTARGMRHVTAPAIVGACSQQLSPHSPPAVQPCPCYPLARPRLVLPCLRRLLTAPPWVARRQAGAHHARWPADHDCVRRQRGAAVDAPRGRLPA